MHIIVLFEIVRNAVKCYLLNSDKIQRIVRQLMTNCLRIIFKTSEFNCATKIIIIRFISNLKFKKYLIFQTGIYKSGKDDKTFPSSSVSHVSERATIY